MEELDSFIVMCPACFGVVVQTMRPDIAYRIRPIASFAGFEWMRSVRPYSSDEVTGCSCVDRERIDRFQTMMLTEFFEFRPLYRMVETCKRPEIS